MKDIAEIIEQDFNLSPAELDERASAYEESIMDMFEVSRIGGSLMELTHFFNDELYFPVTIPKQLMGAFEIGQVFLMTLGRSEHRWEIVYISPPYEEFDWNEGELEEEEG